MKAFQVFVIMIVCIIFQSCADPMVILDERIKKAGFISYQTPMKYSSTGTLVGRSPRPMEYLAPPTECFPTEIEGNPTKLRFIDDTKLPDFKYSSRVSGDMIFRLFNFLEVGSPSISAGVKFDNIKSIYFKAQGASIEYMNAIKLTQYYRNHMPEVCKEYLDRYAFIIQALRVDKMEFSFYNQDGGQILIDVENIEQFLDIHFKLKWHITESSNLVITSPKYIGYQIARIPSKNDGLVISRSSKVKREKYIWKNTRPFHSSERFYNLHPEAPLPGLEGLVAPIPNHILDRP